jgi:hypothetical protein
VNGRFLLLPLALLTAVPSAHAFPGVDALSPLRREEVARHTPDTLWERIDGEAERYRAHGLVSSEHAVFQDQGNPDRSVELSIFSLRNPLGAFALFTGFRHPTCTPEPLGNGGCVEDYQGFFWAGSLFILADASGDSSTRIPDLRRALEAAARDVGATPELPKGLETFASRVDPATVRYRPDHLLDLPPLPPGLEGTIRGERYLLGAASPAGEDLLPATEALLEQASRFERDGLKALTGRHARLGELTLAVSHRGMVGVLAPVTAPGVWETMVSLLAAP